MRLNDVLGQTAGKRLPIQAVVGGLVNAAVGSVPRAVLPRAFTSLPQGGVTDLSVRGIDEQVGGAGVGIFLQHRLEVLAAVHRAVYAAFNVGSVRMAGRGYEQAVGISGIDRDLRD